MAGNHMRCMMALALLCLGQWSNYAIAGESQDLQEKFNHKYAQYFTTESQSLLPLPTLEAAAWKRVLEQRPLQRVYSEPGKYYNNKVYTFTLYRATDDGTYYLDAKGGFWGMDELAYGPLTEKDFE